VAIVRAKARSVSTTCCRRSTVDACGEAEEQPASVWTAIRRPRVIGKRPARKIPRENSHVAKSRTIDTPGFFGSTSSRMGSPTRYRERDEAVSETPTCFLASTT